MENVVTHIFIVRYRWYTVPFAFIAMAIFHLPLKLNKNIKFYKLMGCGRNGTFDKTPDLMQWCIMCTTLETYFKGLNTTNKNEYLKKILGGFINAFISIFCKEKFAISLATITTHGTWDGTSPFGNHVKKVDYNGPIAVLTRATIRLSRFSKFWANVNGVAQTLNSSPGFVTSIGIGEIPWVKQATFSIWETEAQMMAFAYKRKEHATVVNKTKKENWYSEDLFARFIPLASAGTIKGENKILPLLNTINALN
jgi:hypothetical protein